MELEGWKTPRERKKKYEKRNWKLQKEVGGKDMQDNRQGKDERKLKK